MGHYLLSSVGAEAGGLFLLDSQRGELRRLCRGRLRGLTWGPDGYVYSVTGLRQTQETPTRILRFCPERWTAEDLGPVPWRGCHDFRWVPAHDCFYLVASLGNYVLRLDASLRELDRMQLVASPEDVCHVNCLTEHEGDIYVSVFTLSGGRRQEKRLTSAWTSEGKILRLDYAGNQFSVMHEPLAQPHSLVWREGKLYLLESHVSELTRVDPAHSRTERLARLTGFTRGLAFGDREAVIGVSRKFRDRRRQSRRVPILTRLRERLSPFEGVVVLDAASWRVRRKVPCAGLEAYDILPFEDTTEALGRLGRVP